MLDALLHRPFDRRSALVGRRLSMLSADVWTVTAFAAGGAAAIAIGHQKYLLGLGLLVLGRVLDVVDGAVARTRGVTAFGGYLDLVLSLVVSAAVPFGFALAMPDRALAAMFLMVGLVARAAALTEPAQAGGALAQGASLVGKSELFAAFALACVFPNWFSMIAYIIGIACFISAGSRVAAVAAS